MNAISIAQKLTLAAAVSAVTSLTVLAKVSLAQYTPTTDTFNDPNSEQGEATRSSPLGGALNPIDMMHNANLSRSRNGGEFAEDTRRNLKDAASEFKRLQLQRLQEQQAGPSPTPMEGN